MTAIDSVLLNSALHKAATGERLVIWGVAGEGLEIAAKAISHCCGHPKVRRLSRKLDPILNILGGAFLILVVVGLMFESSGNHAAQDITLNENSRLSKLASKAEIEAAEAKARTAIVESNSLALKTNLADLSNKTLELARQYDLSTNALVEANARLAAIRPLKERIVAWCNVIDPRIVVRLNLGQTNFKGRLSAADVAVLRSLEIEPGANRYILSVKLGGNNNIMIGSQGQELDVELTLSPELVK